MNQFDEHLDVFFGEATPTQARVYARLARGNWPVDAKLTGKLSGPKCIYAETLPASYRFRSSASSESILAEAVVPDPCFWTPQLPYLYQVDLQLKLGAETLAETSRPFGIRPLGVRGKSFVYAGKRWVLRGGLNVNSDFDFLRWHEAEAAILVDSPKNAWCAEADRVGVMLAAKFDLHAANASIVFRELIRHASIGMLVCNLSQLADLSHILREKSNCILIQELITSPSTPVHPRAQALLVEASSPTALAKMRETSTLPIIACRSDRSIGEPAQIRSACDRLQADLAPYGDFAGYLV